MVKSLVAVKKTSPSTVLEDYQEVMRLARYQEYISKDRDIALKINISWHFWYPACSTTPWQLHGVIKTLLSDGYSKERLYGCNNRTVVVSARRGMKNNHLNQVLDEYRIRDIHLYEKGEKWQVYYPKAKMLVLDKIFPQGIELPSRLIGDSIIHLPTCKTHVFTVITGAMKNAFGGLLHERRHWTHSVIDETLVDLLAIQKEIHGGIFCVMDGTFAGDGPGPRCLKWREKDVILASGDQVAIDAIAAKIMGFDPLSLRFIRLAYEQGLGCGNVDEIEVVGDDIEGWNWGFQRGKDTFASWGQKMIYWGPLKPLEKVLLQSFIAPWSYICSFIYHDVFWYNLVGRRRVREARRTKWGRLFESYGREGK
jgi:uncharacterized protein (DUF362 family)